MIVKAVDLRPGDTIIHHETGDHLRLANQTFVNRRITVQDEAGKLHTVPCDPHQPVSVPDGRALSTVEDLDALPVGTVVVTDAGTLGYGIPYRKQHVPGGTTWSMPFAARTSPQRLLNPDHSAQPIRLLREPAGAS